VPEKQGPSPLPASLQPQPGGQPEPAQPPRGAFLLLLVIFFISGVSGLVYQVVWTRRLFLTLGATSLAVATILTAFMSGLALGSLIAGRLIDRRSDPLRLYVLLEVGIGIYGALTPWLFDAAEGLFRMILSRVDIALWPSFLLRFAMAFAILLVPTALMGATLPVLSRQVVERLGHIGRRLGTLYGINTLGAAAGVVLTGFIFITTLGIRGTTWLAAGLNAFVAFMAWGLDKALRDAARASSGSGSPISAPAASTASPEPPAPPPPEREAGVRARGRHAGILAIAALGGFASFLYELGWTRVLTLVLGGAVQAYSIMLATFLVGLALGSVLLCRRIDRSRDLFLFYAVIEGLVAISSLAVLPLFGELPWASIRIFSAVGDSYAMMTAAGFGVCFLMMIVPTLLIGVTFPVLAALYARDLTSLGRRIGEVYFANTAGGIVGSFAGGFLIMPWLGMEQTLIAASLVNAGCAVLAAFLGTSPRRRQALTAGATLAAVGLLLAAHPLDAKRPIVELPRVADAPQPPPGWPSAFRGACQRCGAPAWLPDPPPVGGAPLPYQAFCSSCVAEERRWQAEELRTAPRWFWDPRVMTSGVHTYARLYASSPDGRALRRRIDENRLLFYEEGLNCVVTVTSIVKFPGNRSLQINGKTDASNLDDFPTEILLAGLPLLLHPDPKEVLVIGLGSGITAGAATRYDEVKRIDAVEIEAAVARGALQFARDHGDVLPDPGRRPPHPGHPKLRLLIQDARQHCAVTPSRYDVVISEPSNPWMSGPSHLFTLEHFRNLKRVLKDDGIALQWMHSYSMSPDLVYSIVKTYRAVFDHVLVMAYGQRPGDLFLIGASRPIAFDLPRMKGRMARPAIRRDLASVGYPTPAHLLAALVLRVEDLDRSLGLKPGREALAGALARIPLNTDDHPVVEFEAPRHLHRQESSQDVLRALFQFREAPIPPIEPGGDATLRELNLCPPLAMATASAGLLEGASRVAERGLEARPDDLALRGVLAGFYLQRLAVTGEAGLPDRIQALARSIIERDPKSPAPHLQLGELATAQQHHADAVAHYEQAFALGGEGAAARAAMGIALARAGRDADAAKSLEKAIELDPNRFDAYAALADACERLGQLDRTLDVLNRWHLRETNPVNRGMVRNRFEQVRLRREEMESPGRKPDGR
jgi:predicted membrane-bound spermidine synthase